ncbi:hypothetical protein RIF29_33195 [Crotalaria pallida]|uniref:Uncharacterized protein n=1 Tax=Crotalaria pallida TaxID=3830 RepID=A0AAN9HWN8_CROPI
MGRTVTNHGSSFTRNNTGRPSTETRVLLKTGDIVANVPYFQKNATDPTQKVFLVDNGNKQSSWDTICDNTNSMELLDVETVPETQLGSAKEDNTECCDTLMQS